MNKILEAIQRKWAEYLLEVVVIVASIIGAFMLDSWKEDRDEMMREKAIIQEIALNLEKDIERIPHVIAAYREQDSIVSVLLADNYNKDSIENSRFVYLNWTVKYNIREEGYQKLIAGPNLKTPNYQKLLPELNEQYNIRAEYIKEAYFIYRDFIIETYEYYKRHYPWYADMFNSAEALDYFNNSWEHKNTLRDQKLYTSNFMTALSNYWQAAVLNYHRIRKLEESKHEIPSYIPENNVPITEEEKQFMSGRYQYKNIKVDLTFDHFLILENYQEDFKRVYYKTSENTYQSLIVDIGQTIEVVKDSSNHFTGFFGREKSGDTFTLIKLSE